MIFPMDVFFIHRFGDTLLTEEIYLLKNVLVDMMGPEKNNFRIFRSSPPFFKKVRTGHKLLHIVVLNSRDRRHGQGLGE